jgi:membrane associated rhomboid family serine protease
MVWLVGREAYHIGASNLVYGFAFFLFFSGVFRKNMQSIAMSLLVVFMYGSIVWGVLPLRWEVSWEGHLMGGLAGAFIAYIYRTVDLPPPSDEEEDEEEEEPDFNDWMYTQDPDEWKYQYKPKDY